MKKRGFQPKYVCDEKGTRTGVLLTMREFEAMMEYLEDLYDSLKASKVLAKRPKIYPIEEVDRVLQFKRR